MKNCTLISLLWATLALTLIQCGVGNKGSKPVTKQTRSATVNKPVANANTTSFAKAKLYAKDAKKFAIEHNFNSSFCFIIDMSLSSGQKRFFIYDLQTDEVKHSGLVAHGRCNENWLRGRKYGNDVGCGCTSVGKYKIGNAYTGRFGLAFKLYGLDKTNDNAFKRFVVLHSFNCVPETEVNREICQSDGCPSVSPDFLKKLEPMIKSSSKPVLLWILG